MTYTVVFEKITEKNFPPGYYYAHIPVLDLTTHGLGIEGARTAAIDLITLWVQEKRANGEEVKIEAGSFNTTVEIEDAVLST